MIQWHGGGVSPSPLENFSITECPQMRFGATKVYNCEVNFLLKNFVFLGVILDKDDLSPRNFNSHRLWNFSFPSQLALAAKWC